MKRFISGLVILVGVMLVANLALAQESKAPQAAPPQAGEAPKAPEQPAGPKPYTGKVVDAVTKAPIEGAPVTLGDKMVRTNK
ncbi:MAG: hypothetical protein WAU47_00775, partial [Desulfobaccales bacterium]